jgi:primosomal protein N' (replication factor Y)
MTGVEVLINLPSPKFNKGYWYRVPEDMRVQTEEGKRVMVQVGKVMNEGYIVSLEHNCLKDGLKPIIKVLDEEPVFDKRLLELAKWMAEYYVCPVSLALKIMIPRLLSKKKSLVIFPRVLEDEINDIEIDKNINMNLMENLWKHGEMSFRSALKYATRDELKELEDDGFIINTGSYKANIKYKTGYVYVASRCWLGPHLRGLGHGRRRGPSGARVARGPACGHGPRVPRARRVQLHEVVLVAERNADRSHARMGAERGGMGGALLQPGA